MDITNISLINLDSITSGVGEVIIGVIVGVITSVFTTIITMNFYLKWQKKEEIKLQTAEDIKVERCKELKGCLREHSFDLVKDVLSKWFESQTLLHIEVGNLPIIAETPLAKAVYEPPNNRVIQYLVFHRHKKSDIWHQAVNHLRAEGYVIGDIQFMDFWLKCETASQKYLEMNLKILERIKNKILQTDISQKFVNWDGRNGIPSTSCYILDNTAYSIYQEAQFMNHSNFHNLFQKNIVMEGGHIGCIWIQSAESGLPYARCPDDRLANEFIDIVYGIAKDKTLTDELQLLDTEKEIVDDKVKEFKEELLKIIYYFEKRHYILKSTCSCCKGWVDELKKLDESYYNKLISPD
jgi:hypothetical protein